MKIGGWWKIDSGNKLKFYFSKKQRLSRGRSYYVFYGNWFVDKNNYLLYEYTSPYGRKRIVFKGKFIALNNKSFVYKLEKNNRVFSIRGQVYGSVNLPDNFIKYTVWVEGRRYKSKSAVIIAGKWDISPDRIGVKFLVRYGRGFESVRLRVSKRIAKSVNMFLEGQRRNKGLSFSVGIKGRF